MKIKIKTITLIFTLLMGDLVFLQAQNNVPKHNFYKNLSGTLARMPISMQFSKIDTNIIANYEYLKYRQSIELYFVKDSSKNGILYFSEGLNDDDKPIGMPVWKCKYSNGSLTGIWYSANRKKHYKISLKEQYPNGSYQFTYINADSAAYLAPKDVNSAYIQLSIDFPKAEKQNDTSKWINSEIKKVLDFKSKLSFEENIKKWVKDNVAEYQANNTPQDSDKEDPLWNWVNYTNLHIAYNQDGYVILFFNSYEYSGGPHGLSSAKYYCFNVKDKKTLNLADIVSADTTTLEKLIDKNLRIQSALDTINPEPLSDYGYFEDKISPSSNFYFSGAGLTFIYNQYEIAPYSMGIIKVFIPWKEMKPYIVPAFAKQMKLQ